jgi:protein-disulfide isomerase
MLKPSLALRALAAFLSTAFVVCGAELRASDNPTYTQAKPALDKPKVDKPKLEAYLRYAEGYGPQVKVEVGDLAPGPVNGYYTVVAHLSHDSAKLDRTYYTPDGQHFVTGPIWDLTQNPFADTLERLPQNGFSFGPSDARVTIVLFSDLECPYCRELAKTLRENVPSKYPRDVRVRFEDFPLEKIHPWARAAAEAGRCLGDQKQDAFWVWHDWVFEHQKDVTEANLRDNAIRTATDEHLGGERVSSCMDNHATAAEIEQSIKAGEELQIQQTPTFFINGRPVNGAVPWATLDALIQMELQYKAQNHGRAVLSSIRTE